MRPTAPTGLLSRAARPGLLVLDIDGVLLDPRPSFYTAALETSLKAACHALERDSLSPPSLTDVESFKAAGGWNDDFDLAAGLTYALVLREMRRMPIEGTARRSAGGLATLLVTAEEHLSLAVRSRLSVEAIRERSAARYAGRARCREFYGIDPSYHPDVPEVGLWSDEPVLADPHRLRATGFALAFFTGRNRAEAGIAAERLGLDVPAERRMVDDGTLPRKPDPEALVRLASYAEGRPLLFVGDSVDDQAAAVAYRSRAASSRLPELIFVRVLSPERAPGADEAALTAGADLVVPGLNDLLRALPARDRRDDV
jgi:HAD superfamily phosphatase